MAADATRELALTALLAAAAFVLVWLSLIAALRNLGVVGTGLAIRATALDVLGIVAGLGLAVGASSAR